VELFVVLIIKRLSAVCSFDLSAAIARSSIALASTAVPSCWAKTNEVLHPRANAASAALNDFAFPLIPKRSDAAALTQAGRYRTSRRAFTPFRVENAFTKSPETVSSNPEHGLPTTKPRSTFPGPQMTNSS
jgi:hypothetical protein